MDAKVTMPPYKVAHKVMCDGDYKIFNPADVEALRGLLKRYKPPLRWREMSDEMAEIERIGWWRVD